MLLLSLAPEDELLETTALNALITNNETVLATMFDPYFVFKPTEQLRNLACENIPNKIQEVIFKAYQRYILKYLDGLLSKYDKLVEQTNKREDL